MTQALMPGDEPIQIKFKPPVAPVTQREPYGNVLPGCGCAMCRQNAEYEREQVRRSAMVVQYGGWPTGVQAEATVPPFNGSIAGFIRGRYDFNRSTQPDSGLHGQVRWRRPGTLEVYDDRGLRQWIYEDELPDGTLTNRAGSMWRPEPEPITLRPPMFTWEFEPTLIGDIPGILRGDV